MATYAYVSGTSGSKATITFSSVSSSPTAYNNLGASSAYSTIGFTYKSSIISTVTFKITSTQGGIAACYIISEKPPNSTQNFNASTYYKDTTSLTTTNLGIITKSWTSISSDSTNTFTNIPANTYLTIIFSKNGAGNGTIDVTTTDTTTTTATTTTACFSSETQVLIGDNTYKSIKNIKRYDEVITNIKTNEKITVSRNISCVLTNDIYKIPKGLLRNNNEIIVRGIHPIWINNNERCYATDIVGVIKIENNEIINDVFYDLQFDIEGTYYVEGIKVDSLSSYHRKLPLCIDDFINKVNYNLNKKILNENNQCRNKPILTRTVSI